MSQKKEQDKTSEKQLNLMEASNLPYTKFKTWVTRMLNELRGGTDDLSKNLIEIEINQSEIKNTITHEMENTFDRVNSGLDEAEDQTCDLKDKIAERTQYE